MQTPEKHIKSRLFASKAHKIAGDMYDGHEYTYHLDGVFQSFVKFPPNPYPDFGISKEDMEQMIGDVLYMHDTIEDTAITQRDIEFEFNRITSYAVSNMTNIEGKTRKETIALTNQKYSTFNTAIPDQYIALVGKPYDRYSNFENAVREGKTNKAQMYFDEYPAFKKAVYREGIADEIWSELDKTYEEAITKFGFVDLANLDIKTSIVKKYTVHHPKFDEIKISIDEDTISIQTYHKTWSAIWYGKKSLPQFFVSNNNEYLIGKLAPEIEKYEEDFDTFKREMRLKVIEMRKELGISKELARGLYDVQDWSLYTTNNPYERIKNPCGFDSDEFQEIDFDGFDVPLRVSSEWLRMTQLINIVKAVLSKKGDS